MGYDSFSLCVKFEDGCNCKVLVYAKITLAKHRDFEFVVLYLLFMLSKVNILYPRKIHYGSLTPHAPSAELPSRPP